MKILDPTILHALQAMRRTFPTLRAFASKLGLSPGQMSKLLRSRVSHLSDDNWRRIKPLLMPYIEEELQSACEGCPRQDSCIFKVIVQNLLDIPEEYQAEFYDEVNEFILKHRRKYLRKS